MARSLLSFRLVRRHCLECCGGERMAVTWCPCDGLHMPPQRAGKKYGKTIVTPALMPAANTALDSLPANPRLWRPIAAETSQEACPEAIR